jgi:hypothetical protein
MAETVHFPLLKNAGFVIGGFVGGAILMGILVVTVFSPRSAYMSYNRFETASSGGISAAPQYDLVGTKEANTVVGNSVERRITRNYLSAHVKDAKEFSTKLTNEVTTAQGKVMSINVSEATEGTVSTGTLVVLIPNAQVDSFLKKVTAESIKIVDSQILSYEITQEYTDLDRRLTQAEETYTRLKEIYQKAVTVEDILKVQRELTNMQSEIDSLKGRKSALDELSSNTQMTIYFSTDELALPYVPEGTFEFGKTFKTAIRALVSTIDGVLALGIWAIVFSPFVIVPGVIAYFVIRARASKK